MAVPLPVPPHGPVHHVAPLAILSLHSGKWRLDTDCRRLAPTLTELTTLDLVGGDAQEAPPGQDLPNPIRVAVRIGGRPVENAAVRFTPSSGLIDDQQQPREVRTGRDGTASVRWKLKRDGEKTQTLTVVRLHDDGGPANPALSVTGRLSPERGSVTISLSPTLTADLRSTGPWWHDQGSAVVPAGSGDIGGWMPVVLPDGYVVRSLRFTGEQNAGTQSMKATLYRHPLDSTTDRDPILEVLNVNNTAQNGDPDFTRIDNGNFCYFVRVFVEKPHSDKIFGFQIVCEPVG
jgi:hypothetical protein